MKFEPDRCARAIRSEDFFAVGRTIFSAGLATPAPKQFFPPESNGALGQAVVKREYKRLQGPAANPVMGTTGPCALAALHCTV